METDWSILPWGDKKMENFTRITDPFITSNFLVSSQGKYADIHLLKSSVSTLYQRHFNKVDTYFSYVGGLVGTFIALFFVMSFYTEKAFEISIAKKLLLDNDSK